MFEFSKFDVFRALVSFAKLHASLALLDRGFACPWVLHVSRTSCPYIPLSLKCSECLMVFLTLALSALELACF